MNKLPNISVIIPALNESQNIAGVIKSIPKKITKEIIVVDNGSTDRTAEIAQENGASVYNETKRGYGKACLKGIKNLSPECEIVIFLDADGSDFPSEIKNLITPIMEHNFDFVIGTRTKIKTNTGLSRLQNFGNALSCFLIKTLFGVKFSDLGPFRAIKKSALEKLDMRDENFGWTVEMQVKAIKNKLKIKEIPVKYKERVAGKSKVSGTIKGALKAGVKIIYLIFKEKLRR